MKKLHYVILPVLAITLGMSSCKKSDTTTTTTPKTTTPTTTAGPQPPTPAPSGNNLSGALISLKMKYTSQPAASPMPIDFTSEIATAIFYSTPGSTTVVDAGTVSVNSNNLEKQTNNTYFKWAYAGGTPSDLGFSGSSNWNVGGSSSVTAFSYNHTSAFPDYSGTVPTSITKANGLSFTFNSSTLTGADSVYIVVTGGSQSLTRSYKATAGTVTISATDLQNFPAVSDNTGVIEICPFKASEQVSNGKNYFFIKEQAIVHSININ